MRPPSGKTLLRQTEGRPAVAIFMVLPGKDGYQILFTGALDEELQIKLQGEVLGLLAEQRLRDVAAKKAKAPDGIAGQGEDELP